MSSVIETKENKNNNLITVEKGTSNFTSPVLLHVYRNKEGLTISNFPVFYDRLVNDDTQIILILNALRI